MAKYLYGARPDEDPRYLKTFNTLYGSVGKDLVNELQNKLSNLAVLTSLTKVMKKGMSNATTLAQNQVSIFGYGGTEEEITRFCKDYNYLLQNFELLAYRSLEYTSTDVAYRLTAEMLNKKVKSGPRTLEENLNIVAKENKILEKISSKASDAITSFWNSVSKLVKGEGLENLLPDLINQRKEDFIKRDGKYGAGYGGLMGEGADYLTAKAIVFGEGAVLNTLQTTLRNSNLKIELVGKNIGKSSGKDIKADLKIGELAFSVKNYTAIRNRFEGFKSTDVLAKMKDPSVDMSIQSSGLLETVINNFEKDTKTNIFSGDSDRYYTFIMNALYFYQYGIDDYYQEAMQALDILVNVYAYVFLIQGTDKKLGYMVKEISQMEEIMPGFMWLTGAGIVPMYRILKAIQNNFETILKKTRGTGNRSGIYAYLKVKGATQAIPTIDQLRARNVYGGDEPTMNGLFYRKSFNSTTSKYQNVPNVLMGRYSEFSKNINTSVKLHLQLDQLENLIIPKS